MHASKYENNDNFILIHYSSYIHLFDTDRQDYLHPENSEFDFEHGFEDLLVSCRNHILARNHVFTQLDLDMVIVLLDRHESFPQTVRTNLIDLNDALSSLETEFNNPKKRHQSLQKLWPLSKEIKEIKPHIATVIWLIQSRSLEFLEHPYQKYLVIMLLFEDDQENSLFKEAFQYAIHFSKNPGSKAPTYSAPQIKENISFDYCVFYCLMFQIMRELVQILPSELSELSDKMQTLLAKNNLNDKEMHEIAIALNDEQLIPFLKQCPSYSTETLSLLVDYVKHGVFDAIKFKLFDNLEKWLENPWEFEKNNEAQCQMRQMRFNQAILERKVDSLSEENKHLRETLDERTQQLLEQSAAQQKMLETLLTKLTKKEETPVVQGQVQHIGKKGSGTFF